MYATQMQAYRNSTKAEMSDREIDAYALTQAALKLRECQQNWDMTEQWQLDRLCEALRINGLLWSIFQAELSSDGNPLPRKLREDLLTLSIFVDKRSLDIMAHPTPEKLQILIDINLNLAAGLRVNAA
jgi:flagellar biosynthesis activator protein FlaF